MRRILALLMLAVLGATGVWLRDDPLPGSKDATIRYTPIALPGKEALAALGPFRLEHAWRMDSPHRNFGGWSSLQPLPDGTMLAFGDRGYLLHFSPPGGPPLRPFIKRLLYEEPGGPKTADAEGSAQDPATGDLWVSWEGANAISRLDRDYTTTALARPESMHDWSFNSGPESMVRLSDGRFVLLREGFTGDWEDRLHMGALFAGDPTGRAWSLRFTYAGPPGFSPVEMAALPDGRVLILLRRLVWPAPARFAGRIVVADPRDIAPGEVWSGPVVARLTSTLPVDNFEGMAIVPRKDGTVTVWLISDENGSLAQDTILWQLSVDPADLPQAHEKARGPQSARP